jgi:hypothetical protein
VFSSVVKHNSSHTFFGIVAIHDLKLEQLDVNSASLHGELKKEQKQNYVHHGSYTPPYTSRKMGNGLSL